MKDNEVYLGLAGGMIRESFWYARGLWPNEGSPAHVTFNYRDIYDREDNHGDVVGFYHTHPHTYGSPSSTDYATMGAWTNCFGRPLACLIEGIDGLYAHWFIDDETEPIKGWVRIVRGRYFVGQVPRACMLKLREKK